jgi:hypothetical protein
MELTAVDPKPVGRFALLKKELELIFDEGLLLSRYNTYSQSKPPQLETLVLELVALEIAHHADRLARV